MSFAPGSILAGLVLAVWLGAGAVSLWGLRRLPRLAAASAGGRPPVSVVVPIRNEASSLPRSVPSLLAQSYPDLEVIAVDDRSTDESGAILDALQPTSPRLRVIHLREVPDGWLGKPHALFRGAETARGDWLLFTDADVIHAPGALEAAVAFAEAGRIDHLVVIPRVETVGFWERILVSCFGFLFGLLLQPWRAADPRSRASVGIGAFNLIRRRAYQAIGTHRALAAAVVDDLELGRLVKRHNLRQAAARGEDLIRVRWQIGLAGVVSGLEKNAFAGADFSVLQVLAGCLGLTLLSIFPLLGTLWGPARLLWAMALATAMGLQAIHARQARLPAWSALFHPLAVAVLVYATLRSTVLTLRRGGIVWRGTFYPLARLRSGALRMKH